MSLILQLSLLCLIIQLSLGESSGNSTTLHTELLTTYSTSCHILHLLDLVYSKVGYSDRAERVITPLPLPCTSANKGRRPPSQGRACIGDMSECPNLSLTNPTHTASRHAPQATCHHQGHSGKGYTEETVPGTEYWVESTNLPLTYPPHTPSRHAPCHAKPHVSPLGA